jgi:hypothetical protein
MVTLPPEFVETRLPGYFLNTDNMAVYSIKIDGVLKKIKHIGPNKWNHYRSGYRVSHKGQKRWLDDQYLKTIVPHDSVIGVASEK